MPNDPFSFYTSGSVDISPGFNPADDEPLNWSRIRQFLSGLARVAPNSITAREMTPGFAGVSDVNALVALDGNRIGDGQLVQMLGYHEPGDGGGGPLQYRRSSSVAADDVMVFAPVAGPGRFHRLTQGDLSVRQAGARGIQTDDTDALARALHAARDYDLRLIFPSGHYLISDTITITLDRQNLRITGVGMPIIEATVLHRSIRIEGAVSTYTLSEPHDPLVDHITLTSAPNAQPGDVCLLYSNLQLADFNNYHKSEAIRVMEIAGTKVSFPDRIRFPYSPGDAGHEVRFYRGGKVSVEGIRFKAATASTQGNDGPLYLLGLSDPTVKDCVVSRQDIEGDGIHYNSCVGVHIQNVTNRGCRYGNMIIRCRDSLLENLEGIDCWTNYDLSVHCIHTRVRGSRCKGGESRSGHHFVQDVFVEDIEFFNAGTAPEFFSGRFRVTGGSIVHGRFEIDEAGIAAGNRTIISNYAFPLRGTPYEYLIDQSNFLFKDLVFKGPGIVRADSAYSVVIEEVRGAEVLEVGALIHGNSSSRVSYLTVKDCIVPMAELIIGPQCRSARFSNSVARCMLFWGNGFETRIQVSACTFIGQSGTIFFRESGGVGPTAWTTANFDACHFDGTLGGEFASIGSGSTAKRMVFTGCTFLNVDWGDLQLERCLFDTTCRFLGTTPTANLRIRSVIPYMRDAAKVLDTQQGAIAAPTGGGTQDSESRAAISSILTALRNHGLINT